MAGIRHPLSDAMLGTPQLSPEGGVGMQSASIGELVKAQTEANKEIKNVTASSTNPAWSNTYANLDGITKTVRPIYAKHGLTFTQAPWWMDGHDFLITTLAHTSGQWQRSCMKLHHEAGKNGMQAVGSSITYARRQVLCGMANIAQTDDPEDDDGVEASLPPPAEPPADEPPADEPAYSQEDLEFILSGISNVTGEASFKAWKNSTEAERDRVPAEMWRPAALAKKKELGLP